MLCPRDPPWARCFFSIYVNNLYECSEKVNPVMFAGDSNLLFSSINVGDLFSNMNCELMNLLKSNKLSLNLTKTKSFLSHADSKINK